MQTPTYPNVFVRRFEIFKLLAFLELGATDYLVKPVRVQECKAFTTKMKKRQLPSIESGGPQPTGIQKYEHLRRIGQGMAGAVSVYRNVIDNKEYALKEIDLTYLSDKDKKSSQNEVQFLKVLRGPTIVKFWDYFVDNQKIYIVMEFAS